MTVTLSIVIPYYGPPAGLAMAMDEANPYPAGVEVIVVDDGCPEPVSGYVPERVKALIMPAPKVPWNIPACCNRAAEIARGEYMLILPADHLLSPDDCQRLVDWCIADNGHSVGQLARDGLRPGCGILCVPLAHYLAIGGMDVQYCGNYGYGGNDLRRRLGLPIVTVPIVTLTVNPAGAEKTLSRDATINRAKFDAGPRGLQPLKGLKK